MANKTIPELPEIDLEDLTDSQLLILDAGTETFKLRMETLRAFIGNSNRIPPVEVVFDGVTTGDIDVDVSAVVADARNFQWMLKKPQSGTEGEQMPATTIRTPNATTVRIVQGDFVLDAGTYTLLGV